MKSLFKLFVFSVTAIFISCSSETVVVNQERNSFGNTDVLKAVNMLNKEGLLLTKVDKNIQDSVLKRIRMDLNPNQEHFERTAQVRRNDIPRVDFASLRFVPTIALALVPSERREGNLLKESRECVCLYGKTLDGKDVYMIARYKDWNKVKQKVDSPLYKARLQREGKEKVDAGFKRLQSRVGVDCWRISVFTQGDIMFQLMDYARKQSDDGSFFIMIRGNHHFEICYFKDGKPMSCRKATKYDEIIVTDMVTLVL